VTVVEAQQILHQVVTENGLLEEGVEPFLAQAPEEHVVQKIEKLQRAQLPTPHRLLLAVLCSRSELGEVAQRFAGKRAPGGQVEGAGQGLQPSVL
jgi:hypothetical protein